MSNDWKDYNPAPIEVFHSEAMEQFHQGAEYPGNETFVEGVRFMNGIEVNNILAVFKVKIMNEYKISSMPTPKEPKKRVARELTLKSYLETINGVTCVYYKSDHVSQPVKEIIHVREVLEDE